MFLYSCLEVWIDSGIASNISNANWYHSNYKCNGQGDAVHKFAIKINGPSGADPTGLSYIWMECKKSTKEIRGGFRKWGSYGTTHSCKDHMVGYQIQICNEDVGATDLRMFCSRNDTDYKSDELWGADDHGPCNWGPVRYCPVNYAICGFHYEYESRQESPGDNAALTNLKMLCCRVE